MRTLQDQEGWEAISEATGLTVQTLLETKMTGKNKHDLKGKLDQCMSYIKNLRACIRFLDTETQMLEADRDSLEVSVRELQEEHNKQMQAASEAASQITKELEEQTSASEEQRGLVAAKEEQIAELQDKLAGATNGLSQAGIRVKSLEEDVGKLQPQLEEANKQLANTQELYNKSQDYIANLQEYNAQKQRESIALNSDRASLQEENKTLSSELAKMTGNNTVLQAQLESCKANLEEMEKTKAQAQEDCTRLRTELANASGERDNLSSQLATAQAKLAEFEKTSGQAVTELKSTRDAKQQLEHKTAAQATTIQKLQEQLAGYQVSGETAQSQIMRLSAENTSLQQTVSQLTGSLQQATSQIHGHEAHRRKLHNTILEIKGNIRVFCRVRPPSGDSAAESVKALLDDNSTSGSGLELSMPGTDSQPRATHMFTFDRVFGTQSTQEDVFSEISQLAQSALDGHKVCIFAYGQTGSGKTHTMLGDMYNPGMIPRAMEQIFVTSKELEQQGWKFTLTASMMEIHNEEYKDLLGKGLSAGKSHKVVHDAAGNTTVSDLKVVDVSHPDSFEQLLTKAMASRSVGATALNERSSRSHCVFTLRIDAVCEATGEKARGVLNLIDLAGSERLSKSLAQGDRLKETQAINKSLSALGDVISAIGSHAEHVPYRNSKLTWYLQPCLGGDAKTLMFVNVAPTTAAANETLCSLRFATKVNACEVGGLKRSRSGGLKN